MTQWILPLWAALAALAVAATSTPARACTFPGPMLLPIGLVPDQGNLPGVPAGGQILLQEPCLDAGCTASGGTNFAIVNSAGTKLPISFDYLPRTPMDTAWRLIRVRPDTPLAPGEYRLQTIYMTAEISYPFVVRGTASDTPTAKFEIAARPVNYPDGNGFACQTIQTSCGPQTPAPVTTQRKRRVAIVAQNPQVPTNEVGQFLYRLVSTDAGTDPERAPYWLPGVYNSEGVLTVEYRDARDEYCVELQALRVRDATVQSLGKHCVKYALPSELDPAPFVPCQVDPSDYARAYCADNAFACSTKNPKADDETVKSICEYYPLVCAPFIGNRSPHDRPGCGMR